MKSIIVGLLLLGSFNVSAKESSDPIIENYIKIQEALAADNLVLAKDANKKLFEIVNNSSELEKKRKDSLLKVLKEMNTANDIKGVRSGFKTASAEVLAIYEKSPSSDYIKVYCPMAGAKWLQKNAGISNPFFGKEMLSCGEKIK